MINGTITLKNGAVIEIDDSKLVAGSLKVTMSTCSASSFDVGTFNAGNMNIGIYDDEALDHEFDGADIALSLVDGENSLSLGRYLVDGTQTKRRKNEVSLYATDYSVKFDVALPESMRSKSRNAENALTAACTYTGVSLAQFDIASMPNYDVNFNAKSKSIQTMRDFVMWTAQLLCCNAVINRDGALELRYAGYNQSGSEIITDYLSKGGDRISIQFSDVRTYIRYLSAYSNGAPKDYVSDITVTDEQARAASFNLPDNPLLDGMSANECDSINGAWLEKIDGFLQRQIKSVMYSNPALKLGDAIRFSGGSIDVRRSIVGVVTGIEWKYHGHTTITCSAPRAVKT